MKVGILSMHRVYNYGSVLQAYALQKKMEELGIDSEYIDYVFPKPQSVPFRKKVNLRYLASSLYSLITEYKRNKKIKYFRKKNLKLSSESYTRDMIVTNPPIYDVYCSGSDQVWNPLHIGNDFTFLMDFAPASSNKIAYASSFACDRLPENLVEKYSKCLSDFKEITVREDSGVYLVKQLTGKDSDVVCDPTLLLNKAQWSQIADKSSYKNKSGYILVFLLRYMFDPRPHFFNYVKQVQNKLKLPVYYIGGGMSEVRQPHSKVLFGVGPEDFVCLMKNASIILTDSFHGTAFATIFNRPLLCVVNGEAKGSGRITTLRNRVCGEKSIIYYNEPFKFNLDLEQYLCDEEELRTFSAYSAQRLRQMINTLI